MKRGWLCFVIGMAVSSAASAETVYITDQLTVSVRAEAASTAPAVKTVTTGTALEVIERGAGFVRVRDAQGIEGWVPATVLSAQPPASQQLKGLRAELDRTRAELVQAQTQLDKNRAVPGKEQAQAEVAALQAQIAQLQGQLKQKDEQLAAAASARPSDTPVGEESDGGFSFLWLGIAFAMLPIGFVGGVVWVRESIRRRNGGMYLRI